jgi:hypothetical protein
MSARKVLRIVLILVVLALLWMRGLISLPLAALLVMPLLAGVFRKRRLPRDDVPKRPLGLDS